jgi:hypothetical protein
MERERREEKGRGRDGRPGDRAPKIFGLEPPLLASGCICSVYCLFSLSLSYLSLFEVMTGSVNTLQQVSLCNSVSEV